MYRNILNNVRKTRIYNETKYITNKERVKKPKINFNKGDHLCDNFHFLLKDYYKSNKDKDKDKSMFLL